MSDDLKRKPQQVDEETHNKIGEFIDLLANCGIENVSRGAVVAAAVRVLYWYVNSCRKAGYTYHDIWGDVTGTTPLKS